MSREAFRFGKKCPARSWSSSSLPAWRFWKRLRARGTDDETTIERRLANARREIEMAAGYDVHVINDELDRAVDGLAGILEQHGCGLRRNHD